MNKENGNSRWLGWFIVFLIAASTLLNYLDRQTLSILARPIQNQLHFGDQNYAFVVNAFMAAYLLGTVVSGWIVDRLGAKWSMALFVAIWSIASAASGLVDGYRQLAVARFILGLAEVGNFIAAPALITLVLPANSRSLGVGIYTASAMLGAAICPPFITSIYAVVGWRVAFIVFGALGLAWCALWALGVGRTKLNEILPSEGELAADAPKTRPELDLQHLPSWRATVVNPKVWGLAIGGMLTYPVWYFYLNWFPKYLTDERGLSTYDMGHRAWLVYAAAGIGSLVGGVLPALIGRTGLNPRASKLAVLAIVAICGPVGLFNAFGPSVGISIGLGAIVAFFQMFWQVNLTALPSDYFTQGSLSRIYALIGLASGAIGIGTTWLIGQLVHIVSYKPMFLVMAAAYPCALAGLTVMLKAKDVFGLRKAVDLESSK